MMTERNQTRRLYVVDVFGQKAGTAEDKKIMYTAKLYAVVDGEEDRKTVLAQNVPPEYTMSAALKTLAKHVADIEAME